MTKKIYFLAIVLFLNVPQKALAYSVLVNDQYVIHLNKSFYVTGEIIWYKIYLPNKFKHQTVSFEVNIIDDNGKLKNTVFLKNAGETYLNGHYKIPYTASSGMYQLLFLGTNQDNHEIVQLTNVAIPIYNDLEANKFSPTPNNIVSASTSKKQQIGNLQVTIKREQNIISKRGLVTGEIFIKDQSGNPVKARISMTVTDSELTNIDGLNSNSVTINPSIKSLNPTDLKNGLHLKGVLKTEAGQFSNSTILGYFSSKEKQLKYNKTDKNGLFFIGIADFYGTKPIQFIDYDSTAIRIEFQKQFNIENTAVLPYNSSIGNYLQLSRRRKKMYQYYDTKEIPIEAKETQFEPSGWTNFRRIEIDKYESFKDLPTFLIEVSSPLKFELDKNDKYQAVFFINKYGDFEKNPRPPLFIVDGKLTRDADFVARLGIEKIKYIDFINDLKKLRRQFGPLGQYGVAVITTKSGNQKLPNTEGDDIFNINGYQRPLPFPIFDPNSMSNDWQQPILRPQLYWNPILKSDDKGKASFSFFQSDDLGTFRIEVVAQSESGDLGYGSWIYDVVY